MQHSGFEVDIGAYYAVEAWLEAGGTEASHQG